MKKTLKIGEKDIELLSNARTSIYYTQLFHKDFFKIALTAFSTEIPPVNETKEIAFIMNKQAEKADFNSISEEDFYNWLEQFEELDMVNASDQIVGVYLGNTEGSAESKK